MIVLFTFLGVIAFYFAAGAFLYCWMRGVKFPDMWADMNEGYTLPATEETKAEMRRLSKEFDMNDEYDGIWLEGIDEMSEFDAIRRISEMKEELRGYN